MQPGPGCTHQGAAAHRGGTAGSPWHCWLLVLTSTALPGRTLDYTRHVMGSARGRLQGAQRCGRQPSPSPDHSLGHPRSQFALGSSPRLLVFTASPGSLEEPLGSKARRREQWWWLLEGGREQTHPMHFQFPPLQNPIITIMVSVYFQLAPLEESSFQQQLVIALWPPADSLITWRAPRSPTLLLLRLPGVEGGGGASTGGGGGGQRSPPSPVPPLPLKAVILRSLRACGWVFSPPFVSPCPCPHRCHEHCPLTRQAKKLSSSSSQPGHQPKLSQHFPRRQGAGCQEMSSR